MLGRTTFLVFATFLVLGCGSTSDNSSVVTVLTCSDGIANGDEGGIDCGGACTACETLSECESDAECDGRACVDGACDSSDACQSGEDCESQSCVEGLCVDATCTDGQQNGMEVGIDCGGACVNCAAEPECVLPEDCDSLICTEGACVDATCADAVRNGAEADIDCGGDCTPCTDGLTCARPADCESGLCEDGQCTVDLGSSYPDGPYGVSVGDTVMDLTFGTVDGGDASLSEIRTEEGAAILLIFSTAAWCGRCAGDMPELIQLVERHQARGLRMRVSLFESADHGEPTQRDAELYGRGNELPFPVLIDKSGQLHQYFPRIALPMVMMIDLESMTLIHADIGWRLADFESLVSARLGVVASTP